MALLTEQIPKVAKARHKVYPRPGREDLEAALWLAAVEDADAYNEVATRGGDAIFLRLKWAARQVQLDEEREQRARRAYAAGYSPADEYFYSLGQLRRLLPAFLDGGVTEHPPAGRAESAPIQRGQPVSYGDWPVMMMDIRAGLGAVKPHQRQILQRYFALPTDGPGRWTHEEIAGRLGEPPEALRGKVYRALRALQAVLGGPSPGM